MDSDGYVYKRNSNHGLNLYWVCRNKDNLRCLARAITDHNNFVTAWKNVHNHPPNLRNDDFTIG